jgi:hypothetical protein
MIITQSKGMKVTKAELLAALDSIGATDETVLDFFQSSTHYRDEGAVMVGEQAGLHPHGIFVQVAAQSGCVHVFPDGTRCRLVDHTAPGLAKAHGVTA